MVNRHNTPSSVLSVTGAIIVAFSVVVFILILCNVIPGACPFVSGLQLIFLGFLFVIGGLTFLLSVALRRKERELQADPKGNPTNNNSGGANKAHHFEGR